MKRVFWTVPVAVVAWYGLGFGPWFAWSQRGAAPTGQRELLPLALVALDIVVLGGLVGGIVAGLILRRLQVAVPLVLSAGTAVWWFTNQAAELTGPAPAAHEILTTLLVATGFGAILGAIGSQRSVLAGIALALPFAAYVAMPTQLLDRPEWAGTRTGLATGLLVAIGFALLLYIACWDHGWRAITWWPVVTAAYLGSFATITALHGVAETGRFDLELATDAFARAFRPFLEDYWPWLAVAVFLAVMIVALKIRVLPPEPVERRPTLLDDSGTNDAYLPDDLGWFDTYEEPRRLADRLPRRREPVG